MNEEEREEMARSHIGLTYFMAKQFKNLPYELEELIGVAHIGLTKALFSYKVKEDGAKFSTYACKAMYFEITNYARLQKRHLCVFPLSTQEEEEEKNIFNEQAVEEIGYDFTQLKIALASVLKQFSERDREVFFLYLKGYKQKEIGAKLKIDNAGVNRIIKGIQRELAEQREYIEGLMSWTDTRQTKRSVLPGRILN